MAQAADLHLITRACMGFHLWSLAGLGQQGDRTAAVTAAHRGQRGKGAVFVPLAMGGAGASVPEACLPNGWRWLNGMETASLSAMRHLTN